MRDQGAARSLSLSADGAGGGGDGGTGIDGFLFAATGRWRKHGRLMVHDVHGKTVRDLAEQRFDGLRRS
ncbi:hypothetical protein SDC9_163506 [bioreactor metagenome]|uniref:Uncharacterized protein n=1 Tax=bioreactor metagenome TaxID=1076179 RepID=A0A645FP04_9ZZZZ